jgi:hydroxylaminobenzene mutase
MGVRNDVQERGRRLLRLGILLFLFGLLTGFIVPLLENPRMGLSSHLEGVLNGVFLVGLGMIWPRLRLSGAVATATWWLAVYGAFANWTATLLAAWWGARTGMPMAALGHQGTPVQEHVIGLLLVSLSLAMVAVCMLVLWGLRPGSQPEAAPAPIDESCCV